MTETTGMLRLMSWLSPVFPTGGFAYSAALEQAVAAGTVRNRADLNDWIAAAIAHGPLRTDAVLLACAHRATDPLSIAELTELALALSASAERRRETLDQGAAFIAAAGYWLNDGALPAAETPLPVAVGVAASLAKIGRAETVAAFLNTFATNQLQCAIRLSVTGQAGAARTLAELEPLIAETAAQASSATLDHLGTSGFGIDIAAMNHETLQPRLFLS